MAGIYNPVDQLIEYSIYGRETYRDGNYVISKDVIRLDLEWKKKFKVILSRWHLPAFVKFIDNGYVTHFINGQDIHGNPPFGADISKGNILNKEQRNKVTKLFMKATDIGMDLGYTLGDITCSNIMVNDEGIFLIDYEVIVDFPLSNNYITVWENTHQQLIGK